MLTAIRLTLAALLWCALCASESRAAFKDATLSGAQTQEVERTVHINPPGADESRYFYFPFEVPARAERVYVSYRYERADGANTIDIGLFDARSATNEDPRGFRGWSGGRRSELSLSASEATPGYMPGALPAGTWRVILGLYKIAPAGVDVTIKIRVETGNDKVSVAASTQNKSDASARIDANRALVDGNANSASLHTKNAAAAGRGLRRWWSGDLHMHTVHSDGNWTIAELIESARKDGLDFIVVTDHNTASHHTEVNRLRPANGHPLVMRGEEITTYGGHTNAWGLPTGAWIDFRVRGGDINRMERVVAEAHRAGALISINHPFALCGGCAWSYDKEARGFDAIEVWNGTWDATDDEALAMWDKILRGGRRITAIASSDSHRQDTPIGQPSTHVAARELSQTTILEAIRQGRVYLTSEATRPVVSFEAEAVSDARSARASIGDEIRLRAHGAIRFLVAVKDSPPDAKVSLISGEGVLRTLDAKNSEPQAFEIECERDAYFRLEVRDKAGAMLALTNPIYVKVGARR